MVGYHMRVPDAFVSLPRGQRRQKWIDGGDVDPVCPLCKALNRHPLAGAMWEHKVSDVVPNRCGFEEVDCWECLYFRSQPAIFFYICVGDPKMAGDPSGVNKALRIL